MSKLINLTTGLPTASNVNFVFDLKSSTFLYLDDTIRSLLTESDAFEAASLASMIHKEDTNIVQLAYKRVLAGETIDTIRFRVVPGPKAVWLSVIPFLEINSNERAIFGKIVDITAEIEHLNSVTKYANKKNSVLHMLAHDLRGPLGMANSLVAVLEKDIDQPKNLEKTKAISAIIQEAIDLISDLVNREFLETMGTALVKNRIDLVKKLTEYVEECKRSALISDRNFTLTASEKVIQVEVDEAKFMQVINNLLSNALKFTHPNSRISIDIEDQKEHVNVTFSDDGIGIPAQLLPAIFDRFTESKRIGLNGEPTTGLGLYIVKEVIGWHDAAISCDSEEGVGTTFTITLPKKPELEVESNRN
jgi:two-component system sensor histidine kinase VicK